MRITTIVCTFNRCGSLAHALESLVASTLATLTEWEALVVDNNSSDQTRAVAEDFCRRYPGHFRYLFEPRPGKSHALNSGISAARGNILAFLDDDVRVESAWLENLTAALHDGEWAGAGGRILPEWTSAPPRWLPREGRYALAPLAAFDLGHQACQLNEPPFGTNMAFRKELFEKYGGFRTDLGPRPGSEIRNEDTEFGWRLLAGGERLRYEPSAVVYHPVPDNRIQKKYFLAWWFDKASADIRQFGIRPGTKYFVAGIPLHLFRNLAVWTLKWMFAVDSSRRFARKITVWTKLGQILECHRKSSEARKNVSVALGPS